MTGKHLGFQQEVTEMFDGYLIPYEGQEFYEAGESEGWRRGIQVGRSQGEQLGLEKGKQALFHDLVKKGYITKEQALQAGADKSSLSGL